MKQRRKRWLWTTVSSAALFVPMHLENTQAASEQTSMSRDDPVVCSDHATNPSGAFQIAESRKPGAGEGGEGGERGAGVSLEVDDIAYLTQLGLVRGHLFVGHMLYRKGYKEVAKTHMKHPGDELYSDLVPAFKARGVKGFTAGLEKLATLVNGGAALREVDAAYQSLVKAIEATSSGVSQRSSQSVKERLRVIVGLIRVAAQEYAVGVKLGDIVNLHEYQDAFGFVEVAKVALALLLSPGSEQHNLVLLEVKKRVGELEAAFPSLMPERVNTNSELLFSVAARIELAALSIEG